MFNGSGVFNPPPLPEYPPSPSEVISSAYFIQVMQDVFNGLSLCVTKDGQQTLAANIPFGGFGVTGARNGTNPQDYVTVAQLRQFGVATIAALQALTSAQTATSIIVASYATPGDGGGGEFVVNAADTTSADDGGHIIVDAAGRRWYRVTDLNTFNVRHYGAPDDGTTDAAPAFLLAAAALIANGGGVFLMPGTKTAYLLNSIVQFTVGNLTIRGAGIGVTTIKHGAWQSGLLVASTGYPMVSAILSNVLIEDYTIDGNRSGFSPGPNDTYGNGVELQGGDLFLIQRVHVKDIQEQSIVSSYFPTVGPPLSIQQGGTIRDCVIENSPSGRICLGIEGNSIANSVINNKFIGCAPDAYAIYIGYNGGAGTNGACIVRGNRSLITYSGAADGGCGIFISEYMYNLTITDNIMDGYDIGCRISYGPTNTAPTFDHVVANNQFLNWNTAGIITSPLAAGTTAKSILAANKIIGHSGAAGFGVRGISEAVVVGNQVQGGSSGISVLGGNGGGNVIVGNDVYGTSGASIDLGSTTNNVVTGNKYDFDINFTNLGINDTNQVFGNKNTSGSHPDRSSYYTLGTNKFASGTAAPTTGAHSTGDVVYNSAPALNAPHYWYCSASGTPGTWIAFPAAASFSVNSGSALGVGATSFVAGASVTVPGAVLGQAVVGALSAAVTGPNGLIIIGLVTAANTVAYNFYNPTNSTITIPAATTITLKCV